MSYYLFDNPKVGLIIALVIEVLMALSWLFARGRVRWFALLAGPVIAGLVLLLDWAVLTNREELVATTEMVIQAAQDEQAEKIINVLSDDMTMSNGMDKVEVAAVVEKYLSGPFITSNSFAEILVRNAEDRDGVVEFAVRTIFDPKSRYAYTSYLRSEWRFEYQREGGDGPYQIRDMVMTQVGGQTPQRDVFKFQY